MLYAMWFYRILVTYNYKLKQFHKKNTMASYMSEEGYKKILEEIQYLESVERPKAS